MTTLHMETDTVRAMASQLKQAAETMRSQAQSLNSASQSIDWLGPSRDEFVTEAEAIVRQLDAQLESGTVLAGRVENEVAEWEEMSMQNSAGYQAINASIVAIAMPIASPSAHLEKMLYGDTSDKCYKKGQIYIAGTTKFDPFNLPPQLVQEGNNCVLYGIFHLLSMKGITLSQDEITKIVDKYRSGVPADQGFSTSVAEEILREKNIPFEKDELNLFQQLEGRQNHGDPKGFTYDASDIRDKLVENLKKGKPVYVTTDAQIFNYPDGQEGHAFNVMGANVDEKGNLISVVVDTNWGIPGTVQTIDGDAFLRDWVQHGGYMLTLK
jgi:hypothetical protein